jgi:hypothetical protein
MNEYSPRKKFFIFIVLLLASWGLIFCAGYGAVRIMERFGLL